MVVKRTALLLSFLFLIQHAIAGSVSISPASYNEYFEPNTEKTFNFRSYQTENVRVYLGGELREFASLDDHNFYNTGYFTVTLTLPEKLDKPGVNTLYVGVIESPDEKKFGTVGGVAAIQAPIRIFVPFPGKYIESNFLLSNINEKEKSKYLLELNNLGTEDLWITGTIELYSKSNPEELLLKKQINRTFIKTKQSYSWTGLLDTQDLLAGEYIGYATLNYGETTTLNDTFSVGEQIVELVDYDYIFTNGTINPMNVVVRSKWNNPMEQVYVEATITLDGEVLGTVKTPSEELEPWQTVTMTGYLDATGLQPGRYLANILVKYDGGGITNKLVAVYVNDPNQELEEAEYTKIILSILIALLILWAIYLQVRVAILKRKLPGEKRKHEKK